MDDDNEQQQEMRQRKMHLEALERDTPKVWRDLRSDYKVDKEFILKALESPRLPNKSEFERLFPQALRFDRDVVLAFCARHDFKNIYYERHLFVPECLTGDKEVMLAYCRQIPRSLQECSDELCDDREVVEAAIGLDGLELQYASHRLQEDKSIVVAACQSNGQALELCPRGPVRDMLTSDRDFMLSVLRKHGGPMLRLVSEPLRNDRELLLEALKHGMRYRWCPFEFQNDKSFVQEALAQRASLYLEMNRTTQSEMDLARAAITSATSGPDVHEKALTHQPTLTQSREVAMALARRGDTGKLADYLIDGNISYRSDREVILIAVERNPKIFSRLGHNLQNDLAIVLAATHSDTALTVLNIVGPNFQQAHPQVTIRAISVANMSNLRLMQASIPAALLVTFDVAVAWMQRLHRLPPGVNGALLGNRDFALKVARYAHRQFSSVSEILRQDNNFIKEAVDINGLVLRHAAMPLRRDLELVVRAVASNRNSLCTAIPITMGQVRQHLRSKLDLHRSFLNDFLRGIAVSTPHIPPAHRSHLPLLDRGVETSQAFKQIIAQFLGVPIGAELALLRKAWNKIEDPSNNDDAPDDDSDAFVDVLEDQDPAFPAVVRRMRQRRMWQFNRARAAAADVHADRRDDPPGRVRFGVFANEAADLEGPPNAGLIRPGRPVPPRRAMDRRMEQRAERLLLGAGVIDMDDDDGDDIMADFEAEINALDRQIDLI